MISSTSTTELTICTVSFGQRDIIEANIVQTKRFNPGVSIRWIIVENGHESMVGRFPIGNFVDGIVIQGIKNEFTGVAPASYHHASGLNRAIKEVVTRFTLVLDPDFYIVKKGWVREILEHMNDRGLAFFGAPYNPKRYMKYRYFPCIHCMFIDLKKVEKGQLDFSPRYEQDRLLAGRAKATAASEQKNTSVKTNSTHKIARIIPTLKHFLKMWLRRSAIVGSSRDTGYGVYEVFDTQSNIHAECAQPVFKFSSSNINPRYLISSFNRFVEKFLPERLCYLPKKRGYFTEKGFAEYGITDVFSRGWDEFVWKDMPFGFHLQGARRDGKTTDHTSEIPALLEIFKVCENMMP